MPKRPPMLEAKESGTFVPVVTDEAPQAHMLGHLSAADQAKVDAYAVCRQRCGGTGRFDFCDTTRTEPKSAGCRRVLDQIQTSTT